MNVHSDRTRLAVILNLHCWGRKWKPFKKRKFVSER